MKRTRAQGHHQVHSSKACLRPLCFFVFWFLCFCSAHASQISHKHWIYSDKFWHVRRGVIIGETHPVGDPKASDLKHDTYFVSRRLYRNFELTCRFRLTALSKAGIANSGIQYRSKVLLNDGDGPKVGGYQADMDLRPAICARLINKEGLLGRRTVIADFGDHIVWDSKGGHKRLRPVINRARLLASIHATQFETYRVVAIGQHFRHYINGHLMADVVDHDPNAMRKAGVIAFQLHVGPPMRVEFKNMRIRQLASRAAK